MYQQNLQPYRNLNLGTTGVVVAAGVVKLAGWHVANQAVAVRYLKFYDKATAPTNSDTPVLTLALPASSADAVLGPQGINFSAGLAVRLHRRCRQRQHGAHGQRRDRQPVLPEVWFLSACFPRSAG